MSLPACLSVACDPVAQPNLSPSCPALPCLLPLHPSPPAGLVVCVRGIVDGQLTVGDAVLFLALMAQLVAPLSYFGSFYRQIQKGLVDMESMFQLMDTQPAVDDAPGAAQLAVTRGDVAFDNVTFR